MLYVMHLLADRLDSSPGRGYYLNLMFWPPVLIGIGFPLVARSQQSFVFVVLSALVAVGRLVARQRGRLQETQWVVGSSILYVAGLTGGIAGWLATQGL